MYTPVNVCTACWQGTYINGICSHCHHRKTTERHADALPLMETVNGRYAVGEVLGRGGYGITYSAWDNTTSRKVALKELFPRQSAYRDADKHTVQPKEGQAEYFSAVKVKFEQEANLLRLLESGDGVVKVYDWFRCNNTVYYSMEFLEGCDLNAYRKQYFAQYDKCLPWTFLGPVVKRLLETLDILHSQNLIHRDISPDNIFLTKDNRILLIDFGSARTYQGNYGLTIQKKPGFTPLEQMSSNGQQGPWTDIYALSATIYLLLSGKMPPKVEDRVNGVQPESLAKLCPELPVNVSRAVEKGMRVKRQDRFQNARSFMQALFGGVPTEAPETVAPRQAPPRPAAPKTEYVYWLQGLNGVYAGQRMRLTPNREVTFGRRSSNEIQFPDNTVGVSRQQCSLLATGTGELLARDAGSSYGTYLNNKRLGKEWVRVIPGSRLRFGNEVFQLNCQFLPK